MHFVYPSHDISNVEKSMVRRCQKVNGDFEVLVWDIESINTLLRKQFPEHHGWWSRVTPESSRIDMGRYFLMHQFGGVFIELDVECIRPIRTAASALPRGTAWLGGHLEPFQLMSDKGHAFWMWFVEHIAAGTKQNSSWVATGASALSAAVNAYVRFHGRRVLTPWRTTEQEPGWLGFIGNANMTVPWKFERLEMPDDSRTDGMGTALGFWPHQVVDPGFCDEQCLDNSCASRYPHALFSHRCLRTVPITYRIPPFVHQTVADRRNLSCEALDNINSWKKMNPGHTHYLWDDNDIRAFVMQHFSSLIPVPFDEYLTATERADVFRALVLHKIGGVYADVDVQCLKPIAEWDTFDEAAGSILGVEYYSSSGDDPKLINWIFASEPGGALLELMPELFVKSIMKEFFDHAKHQRHMDRESYVGGIVSRTGPNLLSLAVAMQLARFNASLASVKRDRVEATTRGVRIGTTRLLPRTSWGMGYETLSGQSCDDIARNNPSALACHQYWGHWKGSGWKKKQLTYSVDCVYQKN
jgi:mannosyltransferase OCH1-like enzyme